MNPLKSILFVCLGNICRSPLAEGLFLQKVQAAGLNHRFIADSAGTSGFHTGEEPDFRTLENARAHGLILQHRARQAEYQDLVSFDMILAMDSRNFSDLKQLDPEGLFHHKIQLIRNFDTKGKGEDVPDPWYNGIESFEEVYQILQRCTHRLFEELR